MWHMWNSQWERHLNRTDFISSIWSCKCQSVFRFNEQPEQTDDPDSGASLPFSGKDAARHIRVERTLYCITEQERIWWIGSPFSHQRWRSGPMERGLVFGSGCAWLGQIVRCWGNTFICLLLMDPRAFLWISVTPSRSPTGMLRGMTNPPCRLCGEGGGVSGGSSLHLLQGLLPLKQWHTEGKIMS